MAGGLGLSCVDIPNKAGAIDLDGVT